jgi:hypothetical protein
MTVQGGEKQREVDLTEPVERCGRHFQHDISPGVRDGDSFPVAGDPDHLLVAPQFLDEPLIADFVGLHDELLDSERSRQIERGADKVVRLLELPHRRRRASCRRLCTFGHCRIYRIRRRLNSTPDFMTYTSGGCGPDRSQPARFEPAPALRSVRPRAPASGKIGHDGDGGAPEIRHEPDLSVDSGASIERGPSEKHGCRSQVKSLRSAFRWTRATGVPRHHRRTSRLRTRRPGPSDRRGERSFLNP